MHNQLFLPQPQECNPGHKAKEIWINGSYTWEADWLMEMTTWFCQSRYDRCISRGPVGPPLKHKGTTLSLPPTSSGATSHWLSDLRGFTPTSAWPQNVLERFLERPAGILAIKLIKLKYKLGRTKEPTRGEDLKVCVQTTWHMNPAFRPYLQSFCRSHICASTSSS